MKVIIKRLLYLCILSNAHASLCPTIAQIKQHQLGKFSAYHMNTDKPLSAVQKQQFFVLAHRFALASWTPPNKGTHGQMKCFYHDKNGASLYVYLGRKNTKPDINHYWYTVTGSRECAAGINHCQFEQFPSPAYLAEK